MLKTYDLVGRHFGWDKPPKSATLGEVTAYLLDRALRAQGVVSLDSTCHLDAPQQEGTYPRLIERRVAPRRAGTGGTRWRRQAGALGDA